MRRLLSPLLIGAVAAAGCGSSGGDPDADPASLVPAQAPVYVEATLKPEGDTDKDLRNLSQKLAGTDDPGGELKKLFDRAAKDGGEDLRWDRDVKPWAGDRVGLFVTSVKAGDDARSADGDAGLVVPTDDPDKAEQTLFKGLDTDRTYKDVKYKVDSKDNTGAAIVGDFAVAGDETAIKAAIDAEKGEKLSDAAGFKQARDQVGDKESVGFAYASLSSLFASLGPQGAALREFAAGAGDKVAIGLDPGKDALRIEAASLGVRGGTGAVGDVLGTLPGDSWFAAGLGDVGAQLNRTLEQFEQLGALGGLNVDQVLAQVESQTGIDVREDLIAWMGDGGAFVRGATLSDIGGALVVDSKDPEKTAQVIPRLGRLLRRFGQGQVAVRSLDRTGVDEGLTLRFQQLPLPVHIAAAGKRFVVAVTDGALDAALTTEEQLADSPAFKTATEQLAEGSDPALFLDMAPVRELVDSTGAAQDDPDTARVRKALDRITTVSAGTKREADVLRSEVVVGVK